ncbi:hypothetical protein HYZ97_02425 [Candidatus Pacearchaeota archaeon]|nr:hypothetical protein [Candidatus Pacearchaeota archaeon]
MRGLSEGDNAGFRVLKDTVKRWRAEEAHEQAWERFYAAGPLDALASTAVCLHELVHHATSGVYSFEPGYAIQQEGAHIVVDPSGKKGHVLSWSLHGNPETQEWFERSSDVEGALFKRIINGESLTFPVRVHRTLIPAEQTTELFNEHHRDIFNTTNGMPLCIESAFYHLKQLGLKYTVRGFRYPHPQPTFQFRTFAEII